MRTDANFAPSWAIPPGRTISDLMASKGVAPAQLARSMEISTEDLDGLLDGQFPLTARVATRLEKTLGASASFWLRREEQYRKQLSDLTDGVDPENEDYKAWMRSLPLKQMQELGWLEETKDKEMKLRKCLEFFNVPNLEAWRSAYAEIKDAAAFRTTDSFSEDGPATAAWLRQGELQADRLECAKWNPAHFESQLSAIRDLTRIADPSEFLPKLQRLCAEAGVAVAIVKAPTGCRASGATFFASPNKAVLLLSFRYLSDDQFWFSFFHEAAHLVLHWNPDLFLLETTDSPRSPQEEEANRFAAERLIPRHLQERFPEAAKSPRGIMRLALDAGVSYGIVVGQLQFRGLVKPSHFNNLKVRYRWESR